jgi:hypothetical protein
MLIITVGKVIHKTLSGNYYYLFAQVVLLGDCRTIFIVMQPGCRMSTLNY